VRVGRRREHGLGEVLRAAADGCFPAPDGSVDVVPPYLPGVEAMVSFTAHAVVATTLSRRLLVAAGADGLAGATSASVMAALAGPGGECDVLDALLVARGTGRTGLPERPDLADHPRVAYARGWRVDVHVHGDGRGLVTVGRGLGGLAELSFEVPPDDRGRGHGRALLRDGLGLVAAGEPVIAAVAPGNAASMRAALAAGFVPIGSVQLVRPGRC
jgi:ribosomal protein S18 acetylase RimI-like enzyme